MVLEHDYGDKQVRLDVHRVTAGQVSPEAEGQPLAWQQPEHPGLGVSRRQPADLGAVAR